MAKKIDSTKTLTLSDIENDLSERVRGHLERTEKYLGEEYCKKYSVNLILDEVDIHEIDIGRDLSVYFEYGVEKRLPRNCEIEGWGNADGFKRLAEFIGNAGSGPTYELVQLVNARHALDNGKSLSIEQIALLAGMSEKSVRNAFYTKGGSRLEGASSGEAGELDIGNHEAKIWLQGRRGFQETTFAISDDKQPESLSYAEISKFIHDRVFNLYGGADDKDYVDFAVSQLGWNNGERLFKIFVSTAAIKLEDCEGLANLIKVDSSWFTTQVMRALWPRQTKLMEMWLKSAQNNKHHVDEGNSGEVTS